MGRSGRAHLPQKCFPYIADDSGMFLFAVAVTVLTSPSSLSLLCFSTSSSFNTLHSLFSFFFFFRLMLLLLFSFNSRLFTLYFAGVFPNSSSVADEWVEGKGNMRNSITFKHTPSFNSQYTLGWGARWRERERAFLYVHINIAFHIVQTANKISSLFSKPNGETRHTHTRRRRT